MKEDKPERRQERIRNSHFEQKQYAEERCGCVVSLKQFVCQILIKEFLPLFDSEVPCVYLL
jgi:hypothetical protein